MNYPHVFHELPLFAVIHGKVSAYQLVKFAKEKKVLSVAIMINGNPVMARSAVNTGKSDNNGLVYYRVDDGSTVKHNPDDGAVVLAKKLLDTIREQS